MRIRVRDPDVAQVLPSLIMEDVVGVRELRQNASALLRRVEAGERLRVSVNGREVAELVPLGRRTWLHYDEVADLVGPERGLRAVTDLLDHSVRDPFAAG